MHIAHKMVTDAGNGLTLCERAGFSVRNSTRDPASVTGDPINNGTNDDLVIRSTRVSNSIIVSISLVSFH